MNNTSSLKQVLSQDEATVVFEYKKQAHDNKSFESEHQLEKKFIEQLVSQGYEYAHHIKNEEALLLNLRHQIESLNKIKFTDHEWNKFLNEYLINEKEDHIAKTKRFHNDYIIAFTLDNGEVKNIYLVDKKNIHNNKIQIINQYENNGKYENRYDVTILVNGLPLVHIELKRRGVDLKEAFNQINRYKNDSFMANSGLYNWIQIFVISNGTITKYFSNTTRFLHIRDLNNNKIKSKTSNSFAFTNFWSDEQNNKILDLIDFTATFFAKHTILNVLTKYCIFTTDDLLLVMRPYQIVAVEKIINQIKISHNYPKTLGTIDAGGYIWHTTGSGKTVTSFKASQIATSLDYVDKVMFVVDRKDLDYQTMKEYDKFEKDAASANASTKILQKNIENKNKKILITTIQKLTNFIKNNSNHEIYKKHCVLIFDECHRSQFGEMHTIITKNFKKYNLFGFTGTPIFSSNASITVSHNQLIKQSKNTVLTKTTEQIFGKRLHTYNIINAISDKNVLPFRIEYLNTMNKKESIEEKQINDIDREGAYLSEERIANIVRYILQHYDQKTYQMKTYSYGVVDNITHHIESKNKNELKTKKNLSGFNSMLAVASINAAKIYYSQFKKQMEDKNVKQLKVGIIYSYGANETLDDCDGIVDENNENTENLDQSSRDFLEDAIKDYNKMFGTTYDTSGEKFQNYYKDVSMRLKNKELDLLIVVNMFLTGFDAPTLNTLWVDKWMKMHGLIQAFSRTNRILNSIKSYGNIVCFRNLQLEVNEAISLFGNEKAAGIIILRNFNDYYEGYVNDDGFYEIGYKQLIKQLKTNFPIEKELSLTKEKQDFIKCFSRVLHLRNILLCFDDFKGNELLTDFDLQNYLSNYQDIYQQLKEEKQKNGKENIIDDLVFEIELVKQNDIDIDYIFNLINKLGETQFQDKEILSNIARIINASYQLRSKKELIDSFIESLKHSFELIQGIDIVNLFNEFVKTAKQVELEQIINEYNLNPEKTKEFINDCFKNGEVKTIGVEFSDILPKMSRFNIKRNQIKKDVAEIITKFFDKYC